MPFRVHVRRLAVEGRGGGVVVSRRIAAVMVGGRWRQGRPVVTAIGHIGGSGRLKGIHDEFLVGDLGRHRHHGGGGRGGKGGWDGTGGLLQPQNIPFLGKITNQK